MRALVAERLLSVKSIVTLVLTGTLLPGGGPLSLGSVLKTGGLILGVACWVGIRLSPPIS